MNPVVAILKRAREMVASGWIQDAGMSSDGRKVCAVMAINVAFTELIDAGQIKPTFDQNGLGTPKLANDSGDALMEAINDQFAPPAWSAPVSSWPSIPFWNDWSGRTQDEVVETFDYAIKTAERDA